MNPIKTENPQNKYYRVSYDPEFSVDSYYVFKADKLNRDPNDIESVIFQSFVNSYNLYFSSRQGLLSLPELRNPHWFFQVSHQCLRILGSNIQINVFQPITNEELNQITAATNIPLTLDDYRVIYKTLEKTQEHYTDYYNLLLEFKWQYSLISFPLFDKIQSLQLNSGWLLITENNEVLNESYVYTQIRKTRSDSFLRKDDLFSSLTKKLLALRKELTPDFSVTKPMDHSGAYYKWPIPEYGPYCFAEYQAVYGFSTVRFRYPGLDAKLPQAPTKELTAYLEAMTGGKIDALNLLAEFLARVFCPDISSKYIWVPKGPYARKFIMFLYQLIDRSISNNLFSLKKNRESNLLYDCMKGIMIQTPSKIFTPNNINNYHISRYLRGETITSPDPFQQYNTYDYCPVILMDQNNAAINGSNSRSSKYRFIELPESYSNAKYALCAEDKLWIKLKLVPYGISLLHAAHGDPEGKDQLYLDFIDHYCESVPSSNTDMGEFYNKLVEYVEAKESKESLPGKTTAMKEIVSLMKWKTCIVRSNKNRKAVCGISLNYAKLKQDIDKLKEKKKFSSVIEEISEFKVCL